MAAAIMVAVIVIRIINIAVEAPTMVEAATTGAASIVVASIGAASIGAARWREAVHIVVRRYAAVVVAVRTLPTAAVAVDAGKNSQHPRASEPLPDGCASSTGAQWRLLEYKD